MTCKAEWWVQNFVSKLSRKESATLNVDTATLCTLRIGGRAPMLLEPVSEFELREHLSLLDANGLRFLTVGHGSNLIFCSDGIALPILSLRGLPGDITSVGGRLRVGAGAWVPSMALAIARRGLSGLEHVCGIPGTLGGLIVMNGGSQRKSIGEVVHSVRVVHPIGQVQELSYAECKFSYRDSIFIGSAMVVVSADLHNLEPRAYADSRQEMLGILQSRGRKFPRKSPNCGSVFVSSRELYERHGPPGAVVESLGLKGFRIGGAAVSDLHANFIVNTGEASSYDVLRLIGRIRSLARDRYAIDMATEVRYVTSSGDVVDSGAVADQIAL